MEQAPGSPQEPQDAHGLPSCHRHAGVPTGVRCTRCDRPICPECMVEASVGFQCPECVRGGSGTGHARTANQPRTIAGGVVSAGDPQLITKVMIGLNLLVFLVVWQKPDLLRELYLIGLAYDPRIDRVVGVADGEWYRLVTSTFLHQELWHIGFNVLSLWVLGGPLEAALGRARYLVLYLLSGLAGSALTYLVQAPNEPALGASGAVFGLLGATVVLVRRLNYDARPIMALLVLNLVITFFWDRIAWQAHIGGLVCGAVLAYAMVGRAGRRRPAVQWGACGLMLLLSVGAVLLRTTALT
ncbi:rhomboid family intramembrane serine protease [Streptomyces sp. SP18CS02]|uniref:rhomboid family intramembrane serine protease n=1 Tax=Streptomyces sp. SP18CS02 TaxID=3002531 RepID=UPI002E785574|nr:rhomboid family intramembrane serine protease [Streptomyces sp. SP18CS02]MEE1754385.1 rhomboid family intramembrane serine protease [Streptomyces sp. SP18CS02]